MRYIRDALFCVLGVALATLGYIYLAVSPGHGPAFTSLEKYKMQEEHNGHFVDDYHFVSCENGAKVIYWADGSKQYMYTACWK